MTHLYHITHIDNLPRILSDGGLYCDRLREAQAKTVTSIAHQHIKDRRAKRPVQTLDGRVIAAGGTLSDYVPFYFVPRSPMLYTIHRGNVVGYVGGQRAVVHLVTSVEKAIQLGKPWCFTEGHAEIAYSEYFDDLACLDRIDWPLMLAVMWGGDDERRRRRQAEFLVHQTFPVQAIERIVVIDANMETSVRYHLQRACCDIPVNIERNWYY